nr:site-specific integrase [Herbidospora mongoliensis]
MLLGPAVDAFLTGRAPSTARSYGQTLHRLRLALGAHTPLATVTAAEVSRVVTTAWGDAAARTWNRHLAAIGSFATWAELPGLTGDLARRAEPPSARRPVVPPEHPGLSLRERALWSLLYESSAPISRVLALNVDDLDLDDRRARNGVSWRSRTARLLPELVGDRTRGPLFLSDRRPAPARRPADDDLCPHTGRRRLSYERAEYLFKQATGHTLRDLR